MSGVTAHAILRWLERVERIDLQGLRDECVAGVSDANLVALLRLRGFDIEQTIDTILSPATRTAIRLGAIAVRRSGFEVMIKDGVVVTILRDKRRRFQKEAE